MQPHFTIYSNSLSYAYASIPSLKIYRCCCWFLPTLDVAFAISAIWLFTHSPNSYIFAHFIYTLNDVQAKASKCSYKLHTRCRPPPPQTHSDARKNALCIINAKKQRKRVNWKFYVSSKSNAHTREIEKKKNSSQTHKSQRSNKSDELDKQQVEAEEQSEKKNRRHKQNFSIKQKKMENGESRATTEKIIRGKNGNLFRSKRWVCRFAMNNDKRVDRNDADAFFAPRSNQRLHKIDKPKPRKNDSIGFTDHFS